MKEPQVSVPRLRRLRKYDKAFKQNAVDLTLRSDRSVKDLAKELGITEHALYRWRHEYMTSPNKLPDTKYPRSPEQKDEEIRRLRAENEQLREREIILKKSLGILSETPERGMPRSTR